MMQHLHSNCQELFLIRTGNKLYLYYQMFRQQSQINCNCSLFPASHLQTLQFRSPPPFYEHRKEHKSKKSLKYHSSSRNKDVSRVSAIQEQMDKITSGKIQNGQPFFKISDCSQTQTGASKKSMHVDSRYSGENIQFTKKDKPPTANNNIKQKHKGAFQMNKENKSIHGRVNTEQSGLRAASPFQPIAGNQLQTSKQFVTFNYQKNQYDLRPTTYKVIEVSPPPINKMYNKNTEGSATTTLAGSIVPNNPNEVRKRFADEKNSWTRQSFNHPFSLNPSILIQNCEDETRLRRPSEYVEPSTVTINNWQSRQRPTSNIFGLSRLDEIMNERQETESIYEDGEQPSYDENAVEYSRVLISCKKLMQEKNGILEQSAQTKLFDYDDAERRQACKTNRTDKASMHQLFEAIPKI